MIEFKEMMQITIKIVDLGLYQGDLHNVTRKLDSHYNVAPEILDGMSPYDGEKADVFASAFILLALYSANSFS